MRAITSSVAIGVLLLSLQPSPAQVDGDRFQSEEWNVGISTPANWRMSQQSSYPDILLWMHRHSPPGRMLLSAERLQRKSSSLEYAERTRVTLTELGFAVKKPQLHAATGAYWIEFDDRKTFLRQALLVAGDIGYSLTLSAPDRAIRDQHLRAFDYALRSIKLNRERLTEEPPQSTTAPANSAQEPQKPAQEPH